VADPRTLKVIVTASKDQMPEIADMVTQLDTPSGRKQETFVYTLENASVKRAETMIRSLFPSSRPNTAQTNQQQDAFDARANSNATAAGTAGQNIQLGTNSATTNR
jgi:hypothetical protein